MYFKKLATFVAAVALSCFSVSTAFADFAVGDRGMEVIEIQKQLAVLQYNVGEVDGVFGPATEKAVKDFQSAKGLKVDGIVNDATYRNLMNKEMPPLRQPHDDPYYSKGCVQYAGCSLCIWRHISRRF